MTLAIRLMLLLGFLLALPAGRAEAQTLPAGLDRTERRVLQAALALSGDYDGLVDGDFGRRSAGARDALLARREDGRSEAEALADLLRSYRREWEARGWGPARSRSGTTGFVRPQAPPEGLSLTEATDDASRTNDRHARLAARHVGPGRPYTVRRGDLLVTASELAEGGRAYMRSDRNPGGDFDTLEILATEANRGRLQLVASSMTRGASPALAPPEGGALMALAGPATAFRGTGVVVAPGMVLAALSAIEGCAEPLLERGSALVLLSRSETLGLVLLAAEGDTPPALARATPGSARLAVEVEALSRAADGSLGRERAAVVALSGPGSAFGGSEMLVAGAPPEGFLLLSGGGPAGPVLTVEGTLLGFAIASGDDSAGTRLVAYGDALSAFLPRHGQAGAEPAAADAAVVAMHCRP